MPTNRPVTPDAASAHEPLVSLSGVQHLFRLPSGKNLHVLDDIDLTLRTGE